LYQPLSVLFRDTGDIRYALVIKEGNLFLVSDNDGNVPISNSAGFGLYHGDTRHLSGYELTFDGTPPLSLLSTAELGFAEEQYLTSPRMLSLEGRVIPKNTVELRRERVIHNTLQETLFITNFNVFPVTFNVTINFSADFADIMEIRGYQRRVQGRLLDPLVGGNSIIFRYEGADSIFRKTRVEFNPAPTSFSGTSASFRVSLRHHETAVINIAIAPDDLKEDLSTVAVYDQTEGSYHAWLNSCTRVNTDNELFNAILERSLRDVRLLLTCTDNGWYISAGTPWFCTMFGRDSAITALQTVMFNPELARGILESLASRQGTEHNQWLDEEPGKILHELRTGEMANILDFPSPYFGSVDSTPLFLILAGEYFNWTADTHLLRKLEPNLAAAVEWMERYGDVDGDGFLEYQTASSKGLVNQGWKDSWDAVIFPDGSLAHPPIALAEVQGYAYQARMGMAKIFRSLGREELARRLVGQAEALKARFNRDFWVKEEGFYAMALDGKKKRVPTISSNPGHGFWSGIIPARRASKVAERLLMNDMFSGWGIRTLSNRVARFNPLGYHIGTIWPHDNSIIGMGFKQYGFEDELNEITTALYDCCRSFEYYRLPELYSGAARTAHSFPVRYPVACHPQAWAAATMPFLLQAMLGIQPNAVDNELRIVRPKLPYWLKEVEIRRLRIGEGTVDLAYRQRDGYTAVSVLSKPRGLSVVKARRWAPAS